METIETEILIASDIVEDLQAAEQELQILQSRDVDYSERVKFEVENYDAVEAKEAYSGQTMNLLKARAVLLHLTINSAWVQLEHIRRSAIEPDVDSTRNKVRDFRAKLRKIMEEQKRLRAGLLKLAEETGN